MTALITGASAGIGRDLAERFAMNNSDVILVARREKRLLELAQELKGNYGVEAHVLAADLADPGAPAQIMAEVNGLGIALSALVNNAGFGSTGAFADLPLDAELRMIQVNLSALVALTHLALPGMISRGQGRILNIGSVAGFQAGPYMATYYATKAFVNHFSEALAHELSGSGVTVTVSCPGATATEFGEVSGNGANKLFTQGAAMTSKEVARQAYQAMMSGKPMIIHGMKNKVAVQSLRFSPRAVAHKVASLLNQP